MKQQYNQLDLGQPSVGGLVLLQVKKDRSNRHKEVLDQMNLRIMEAEAKVVIATTFSKNVFDLIYKQINFVIAGRDSL